MAKVEYDDVWRQFPGQERAAVAGLTLDIADGEFLVLLGPSGCGKTTALRMLAGLEHPDRGDIRIDGRSVVGLEPKDRDVALVFQSYALYPHMSVHDNIRYPLRVRGLSTAQQEERVARAAELLRIAQLLPRRPAQLSGGEQQRVALARAIVREPRVFLMDEPLSNLDAKLRTHTRTELKALQVEIGVTTIFVTHDQAEAMTMADRIAVLDAGRLQQLGAPDEVYQHPANLFVAQFIGSPPMNVLAAERDGDALVVAGGWRVPSPRLRDGAGALAVGLRPEAIAIADDGHPAEVLVSEPLGSEVIVNVKLGDVLVKLRTTPDVRPAPGEKVRLRADPAGVRVFDRESGVAVG
ncbi:MAG TPA: ABC transporter ATP-binding protein [Candidatus Limnocylindria bacterium]|nr:ABC transporter ATP-binding protein [Candidatus Limnocylindria bacterium]